MNFAIYLDDSGTASDQPIAIASAFILPAKQKVPLENEWNRFTKANGFSDFHAAACAAPKSKDKQYKDWDDAQKAGYSPGLGGYVRNSESKHMVGQFIRKLMMM